MFAPTLRSLAPLTLLLAAGAATAADRDVYDDPLPPGAVARVGTARLRHGGAVVAIAFAPDGKTFATASLDRTVSVWDRETGRELWRCRGFGRDPLAVAFDKDGKTLACVAADGVCRVFEIGKPEGNGPAAEPKELRSFALKATAVTAVTFSRDGRLLAAGDEAGSVRVWDVKEQSLVKEIVQDEAVRCLRFTADATFLATTAGIEGIKVWEVKTGRKVRSLGKGAYSALEFNPVSDRQLLAGNFDNEIEAYAWAQDARETVYRGHKEVWPQSKNGIAALAYSPDGVWIVSGAGDSTVRVWPRPNPGARAKPGAVYTFQEHTERVTAVAWSPDGAWIVSGAADNTVHIYDPKQGGEVSVKRQPPAPLAGMALSPDGKFVVTLDSPDGRLSLWDARTGKPADLPTELPRKAAAAAFTPDGKTLALGIDGWPSDFRDLKTGAARADWKLPEPDKDNRGVDFAAGFVFDAAGKRLVSTSSQGLHIAVWEPANNKRVALFTASGGRRAQCVALSPDGATLATAGTEAMVRLWDVDGDKEKGALEGHSGGTLAVAFSPSGRLIATGGKDRMIRVWEVASGKQRQALGGHPGWIRAVAFAPGGDVLAGASTDGVVRLWDLTSGRLLHELTGHRGAVTRLAFSAKGDVLASAGADTTVLVWDAAKLLKDRKPSLVTLTPKELDRAWEQLASGDVGLASAALQTLARAPAQAVPLLQKQVQPLDAGKLAKWLRDLDSDQFEVREAARKELAAAGKFAEPALKDALKNTTSPEVRRSAEELLEKLRDQGYSPQELRLFRSLELLELIGGDDAKQVLAGVASGAKESELTRQAKAALDRLAKRSP
jgi:WD40 repeat protein